MFEQKFLAYVLYVTLLEIRENAYNQKDSRLFFLTDMLHNAPFSLLNEESAKSEYEKILETIKHANVSDWLDKRMKEFKNRFPEFS